MGAKNFLPRFSKYLGSNPDIGSNTLVVRGSSAYPAGSSVVPRWGAVYANSVNLTEGLSLGQPRSADDSSPGIFYQITFNDDFYIAQTSATVLKIGTGVDSSANAALTITSTSSITSTGDFVSLGYIAASSYLQGSQFKPMSANFILYEGTPDAHETTMTITDPTADRTITFPDASGTVAMTTDIGVTSLNGSEWSGITTYASAGTLDVEEFLRFVAGETSSIFMVLSPEDDGDSFLITTTTHGATTISTTDDDGTQADLTINVDGEINLTSSENKINKIYDFHGTTFETTYSDDQASGTIIKYSPANNTALNGSEIYYLRSTGIWAQANATDDTAGAKFLLGVGLGAPQTVGVLLKGFVKVASTEILNKPTNVDGVPVYMSTTSGHFDFTAPSSSGNIVRIMGYAVDQDSNDVLIYFDPDKTWVEIA